MPFEQSRSVVILVDDVVTLPPPFLPLGCFIYCVSLVMLFWKGAGTIGASQPNDVITMFETPELS